MNSLFLTRLSDKTANVTEILRDDGRMFLFVVNGKRFTYNATLDGIDHIAELAPYDANTVHNHPRNELQPGGYGIIRLTYFNRRDAGRIVPEFLAETIATAIAQ